jgi:hypothetical protein
MSQSTKEDLYNLIPGAKFSFEKFGSKTKDEIEALNDLTFRMLLDHYYCTRILMFFIKRIEILCQFEIYLSVSFCLQQTI